jgi:hypothetical protein
MIDSRRMRKLGAVTGIKASYKQEFRNPQKVSVGKYSHQKKSKILNNFLTIKV